MIKTGYMHRLTQDGSRQSSQFTRSKLTTVEITVPTHNAKCAIMYHRKDTTSYKEIHTLIRLNAAKKFVQIRLNYFGNRKQLTRHQNSVNERISH